MDDDDLEIPGEHPVSPKRHRPIRNTMSPGRNHGFGNTGPQESLAAFGFSLLPFSPQPNQTASGNSAGSPITFFGRYETVRSPVSPMAMETDEGYASEQGLITPPDPSVKKSLEQDPPPSSSPELYQQFYMNGYSPTLIERVVEERRSAAAATNGRAYPMPWDNPSKEREGSSVFACRMFPRHSDVY